MSLLRNLKHLFGQDKKPGVTRSGGRQSSDPEQTKKKPAGGTEVNRTPSPGNVPRAREDDAEPGRSARSYRKGDLLDNRYEVEAVLSGSMGYVYIGRDTRQRMTFAIKQPKAEMLGDSDRFARVVHEADAWTGLGMHPHIAYCYFVKSIDEIPHIFIEYVDGGNLEDWIGDRRCADYKVGLDMAIQICHGLERAHDRGMIHRDIKPKNILVSQDGQVKITDFGIAGGSNAREQAGSGSTAEPAQGGGTREGDTLGTLYYMPPEQFRDPRQKSEEAPNGVWYDSDIFSVGVCMWEMFCGKRPYVISTDATGSPPDPGQLRRELPEGLKSVLCKSVELDRRNRYQDARELCDALNEVYRELFSEDASSYRLELHDTTADELNNQGYSYYELGKKEEARKCFERAVEINKTHPEAVFNLVLMQWRCGEIGDVEAIMRISNCANYPSVSKEKGSELLAYVHAERCDANAAREVLKAYPGKYEELFGGVEIGQTVLVRTFEGHTHFITSVSLSADGRYALSGSNDETVKLWDVEAGKCLRTFKKHKEDVNSVSLSADGRYGFSGGDNDRYYYDRHRYGFHKKGRTLNLWRFRKGFFPHKCLRSFGKNWDNVTSVSLSADGKYALWSTEGNETIKLCKVKKRIFRIKWLRTFEGHKGQVESVSLSADGKYALSGGYDMTLKLWDVKTGQCLRTFKGHTRKVNSVSLSADGRYALSGSSDQTMKLWDAYSGQCIRTFKGQKASVTSVSLNADARYALSGAGEFLAHDSTLKLWDLKTGKCLRTFEGHTHFITSVSLSADGRYALSGSKDDKLRLWALDLNKIYNAALKVSDFKGFAETKNIQNAISSVVEIAERLIRKKQYAKAFNALYDVWEQAGFAENPELDRVYEQLYEISSRKVFVFSYEKYTFWDYTKGFTSFSFSADGMCALIGAGKKLHFWDVKMGKCLRTMGNDEDCKDKCISLSADGRYALSKSYMDMMSLWDVDTGKLIRWFQYNKDRNGASRVDIESVCLSADGKYALSGASVLGGYGNFQLKLWEMDTGKCLSTFRGGAKRCYPISLSSDGRFALSGSSEKDSYDGTVQLWDAYSGECIHTFKGHTSDVTSVSLNADARYALSGSRDKTMKLWDVVTGNCIRKFEGHTSDVTSVSLSADGRYALSGSDDKTLKLWDVETGDCLRTFKGHAEGETSVSLSEDCRYAMSGSGDTTLKVWRLIWKLEFDEE